MNLSTGLTEISKQLPEKTACVFNDTSYTYTKLDDSVSRFATHLAHLGVKKGDHVAVLLGNCPEYIISLYGALRLGATVIPINPVYSPDEIRYIIENGDVKVVVALAALMPLFEKLDPEWPQIERYIHVSAGHHDQTQGEAIFELKMKPFSDMVEPIDKIAFEPLVDDDTAVILYTSGTTGKPKGAMLTHQNLYSNAKDTADYLQINREDRVIATLPMFHVFCLTVALNAPLLNGAKILIVPKFSPKDMFKTIRDHQATVFAGVPTMYNFLYQYPEADANDLASLRICISGGAAMPVALLHNFEKKFNVKISEGYGLSEAAPVTCFNPLDRPSKPGSIGMSIKNVDNRVVNEMGEELPIGEVGELVVRGPNVMKGYYKMPEESAAALKDGWLYTGDLARQDEDGYFYIVDRKKDMVIVGGYNVYPREVEEVIYSHPEIVEVAVIGVPDPNYGESVKAFVVKKGDSLLTEADLSQFCSEHLAKYKRPSAIEFLAELPKNTTGKILRRALKVQLQSNMNG